jgi:anaerobic magnesium-protoporphyrin IX monomethyl ester cyclase
MPSPLSIGLVTLNAKYVHVALSLRYLRNAARAAGFGDVWLREYTLKTPGWKMAAELSALTPKGKRTVLGFSVYIWNRLETFALIERLKKQDPTLVIVVGGPEVSFESGPPTPYIDTVIGGEGERKWVDCLRHIAEGRVPDAATLLNWRTHGTDLPELAESPYTEEDLAGLAHRLVYLETSRGCPYTCSFCLSALDEKVRFYPEAQVKADIRRLVAAGARRIKFLDRTFNLRRNRVLDFFRFLAAFEGVEFHFEVVGDLLDETLLAFLDTVPPGRFQFEIGVQTADPAVNARVARHQSQDKLFDRIRRLVAADRVHLHADLIWGLPGETAADIRRGFERVLALRPHELQLGFLKFLPGAPIRALIAEHGYVFEDAPPYELIHHKALSSDDVLALKRFEEVFDLYYNSGHFRFTVERLLAAATGWEVFEALAAHFAQGDLLFRNHSLEERARHLLDCGLRWLPEAELIDLLKLDYCFHHRTRHVPAFLNDGAVEEPREVRQRRRGEPDTAFAPFRHEIQWDGASARLVPRAAPVWYAFHYPDAASGYFFRPRVEAVLPAAVA